MPFLHALFPCFGGSGGDEQYQHHDTHDQPPSKRKEGSPRTSSNTSTYAAQTPVSEAPGAQKAPIYRPANTDKKLPPQPGADFTAIELPGSSPDLHEMPATHIPDSHPLARASSTATSTDPPRPSQQSEQQPPLSPYSTLSPGSAAGSTYQPSTSGTGSVRAPSERGDPDEISPAPMHGSYYYPASVRSNTYSNVADALVDRKRMFDRLRRANGVEGPPQHETAAMGHGQMGSSGMGMAVTPVEMEAPMQVPQPQQAPSEMPAREHVRNPSGPKELE